VAGSPIQPNIPLYLARSRSTLSNPATVLQIGIQERIRNVDFFYTLADSIGIVITINCTYGWLINKEFNEVRLTAQAERILVWILLDNLLIYPFPFKITMHSIRRKLVRLAFMAADLVVLISALYFVAWWASPAFERLTISEVLEIRPRLQEFALGIALLFVWLQIFTYYGLYRQRYWSFMKLRPYHLFDLFKATSLGTLLLISGYFLLGSKEITLGSALVFWVTVSSGTFLAREALVSLLRLVRLRGRNLRHLLIVGTNARALEFADKAINHPELGYAFEGFVDSSWKGSSGSKRSSTQIVAGFHDIGQYIRTHVVDEVVITLPVATLYKQSSYIVRICEEHGVVVHFAPGYDFLNIGSSRATFDSLDGKPIIT